MENQKPFKEVAGAQNDVKLLSRSTVCVRVCDVMLVGAETEFFSKPLDLQTTFFCNSWAYYTVGQCGTIRLG